MMLASKPGDIASPEFTLDAPVPKPRAARAPAATAKKAGKKK
jgi:hypothetical protein